MQKILADPQVKCFWCYDCGASFEDKPINHECEEINLQGLYWAGNYEKFFEMTKNLNKTEIAVVLSNISKN